MDKNTFQLLSQVRIDEAETLLRAEQYPGAYYLVGYAVECALKACVAKQFREHDIPDKGLVNKVYTHNLTELVKHAGLEGEFENARRGDAELEANWTIVKDWSESSRYDLELPATKARDIFNACTASKGGVLTWIKSRW